MKNYLLGKEGDQPFEITQPGVSREHARLTIDDNGNWMLIDLDSSNGTYIRNDNGNWERISKKIITPTTYISLGPDNANGCKFYACHVDHPGDYNTEFDYMEDIAKNIECRLENAERNATKIRKLIALVSGVALLGSFIVPGDGLRMLLLRVGSLVSMISTLFFDPNKKKKHLKTLLEKFMSCPNPACMHTLSVKEVLNRRCSKCKTQG